MEATQPTYPKGLDFEQVWAALMENREQLNVPANRTQNASEYSHHKYYK
jgi:hypothetical protein